MRKGALLLALVIAVSAPSLALAKKAKRVRAAAPPPVAATSPAADNGRFFHDAFHQVFVPAETIFTPRSAAPAPAAAPVRRVRHVRRHHRAA